MISDKQKAMKADRLGNGLGDGNGLSWTFGYCLVVGKRGHKTITSNCITYYVMQL